MNLPCASPSIACPGVDSPVSNLSAEQPDQRKFFGYRFFEDTSVICESEDAEIAALCFPPFPTNPPIPVVYSSGAQTCTVICPDTSQVSYTAAAGSAVGLSQAEADAAARAFACKVAAILCLGPLPTIFTNAAQGCSFTCVNGTVVSYTVPAGTVAALSQAEANAIAASFSCALVALLCPEPPSESGSFFGGAGSPPTPPYKPRFANGAQACSEPCPDGSIYTFTAAAGLFIRDTLAEANAAASSYACRRAEVGIVCLGDIQGETCAGVFYADVIGSTGLTAPTWELIGGSLPTGMTLEEGQIAGIPTTGGASTFTVRATGSDGQSAQKTFTIDVIEISPSGLPGGTVSTAYSQALSQTGGALPATWGITGGSLPPGLTLDPNSGVISGTPTTGGTFNFAVSVITS